VYDRLKKEYNIPIYSVISELPKYIEEKKYKNTLVLATNATINSHTFKKIIKNNVKEVACPKLVPIIENNKYDELDNALNVYLDDLKDIDSIILGCTHYPIIRKYIEEKIENIDIIDMGEILAQRIEIKDSKNDLHLYFSKITDTLENNIKQILKK
jgi:glutamate racemase